MGEVILKDAPLCTLNVNFPITLSGCRRDANFRFWRKTVIDASNWTVTLSPPRISSTSITPPAQDQSR